MREFDEAQREELEVREEFVIDNDLKAEWAIKKLAEVEQEHDRLIAVCEQQINEYELKIEQYKQSKDSGTSYFKTQLFSYMQTCKTKATKTMHSYQLASGQLKYTLPKNDFAKDEEKLIEWVKNNKSELIKTKESVDWATLKKQIKIVESDDKLNVITEDGEVVEGISVVEKQGKFDVSY